MVERNRYDGGEKEDEIINIITEQNYTPQTLERMRILISEGADLDQIFDHSYTMLHMAVYFGYLEYIKLLIENGANLDIHEDISGGDTPLHVATFMAEASGEGIDPEQREIIKLLLKSGANTNIVNNAESTARDNYPRLYDEIEMEIIMEELEELRRLESALFSYSESKEYREGIEEGRIDMEILKYIFDLDKMKL